MNNIAETYGLANIGPYILKDYPGNEKDVYEIKSNHLVGIEIEVENWGTRKQPNKGWSPKADGSLRNKGIEWITKPIPASHAPYYLHDLLVDAPNPGYCFSPRTSVHVHLNCLDLVPEQVNLLVLFYVLFEKLFYKYAGRGRMKNVYCVPLSQFDFLSYLVEKNYQHWQKYTGLNLRTLITFGTVEFRHMHGTSDVTKLCIWIDLITKLKEFVLATDGDALRAIILSLKDTTDYPALINRIFGESGINLQYDNYEEVEDVSNLIKLYYINSSYIEKLAATRNNESPFFKTKAER